MAKLSRSVILRHQNKQLEMITQNFSSKITENLPISNIHLSPWTSTRTRFCFLFCHTRGQSYTFVLNVFQKLNSNCLVYFLVDSVTSSGKYFFIFCSKMSTWKWRQWHSAFIDKRIDKCNFRITFRCHPSININCWQF